MKRYRNIIIIVALFLVPITVFVACSSRKVGEGAPAASGRQAGKYTCPMHPNYVTDKPGECPICGMNVVPVEGGAQPSTAAVQGRRETAQKREKIMYRSTMMPNEVSDKPGKDSMGMEMEPFEVETAESAAAPGVEGLAPVKITAEQRQLIGVKTAAVERKDISKTVRAAGRVAYDPDLYYAEQEYLTAYQSWQQAKDAENMTADSARSLAEAARMRLRLLGLNDELIDGLARKGAPDKSLLLSTGGGSVWVYASIYEDDLRFVKAGQTARISAPAVGTGNFSGKIAAIDPVLDPVTRSVRARIIADNPSGLLKPETYLNVEISVPLGSRIVVPADAVMDTGTRQVVFVEKGEGILEPREIKTDIRTDGSYSVTSGLTAGEKVVMNANFLIDSESQLRFSMQKASQGGEHHHH